MGTNRSLSPKGIHEWCQVQKKVGSYDLYHDYWRKVTGAYTIFFFVSGAIVQELFIELDIEVANKIFEP